ncbi:hypothetical protein LTR94_029642, partial [Friedmanniomyces endolithicus]
EPLVRILLADHLREAGFTVAEAVNADEALQYCRTHQNLDLVFTDVQMPGSMDGIALVAQLRELNPFLPIILTSGALSEDEVAGIPFIRKPYDLASAQRL